MDEVTQWGVFETCFEARSAVGRPSVDVTLEVAFTAPSGFVVTMHAFWDGGRTWRVRYSPSETGRYAWRTMCLSGRDPGLGDLTGEGQLVHPEATSRHSRASQVAASRKGRSALGRHLQAMV